jgi:rRNA processing protein Gar1
VVVKPADPGLVGKLKLGFKVYLSPGSGEVGWVSDVIGNVKNPYVVVRVKDRSALESLKEGATLYVDIPPPRRQRGRGRRSRAPRPRKARAPKERGRPRPRRQARGGAVGEGKGGSRGRGGGVRR